MATKQDFTTDERNQLPESTVLHPDRRYGFGNLTAGGGRSKKVGKREGTGTRMNSLTPLIKEVVAASSTSEGRTVAAII